MQVSAELKEQDIDTSLAIVTVNLDNLDKDMIADEMLVATLGSSSGRNIIGTPVVALGSPMGISDSIGYGMVTASSIQDSIADINYKFLQTDISGSQNADGVLFNYGGRL